VAETSDDVAFALKVMNESIMFLRVLLGGLWKGAREGGREGIFVGATRAVPGIPIWRRPFSGQGEERRREGGREGGEEGGRKGGKEVP
jgi:hypothetical protein